MGIIDKYLLGKKGRDEDVFPPIGPSDSDTEDAMGSLQEAYGLPAAAPPPPRRPRAGSHGAGGWTRPGGVPSRAPN